MAYKKYTGYDSAGNDYLYLGDQKESDCVTKCRNDNNCGAVTVLDANCWFKSNSKLSNLVQAGNPKVTTYVKTSNIGLISNWDIITPVDVFPYDSTASYTDPKFNQLRDYASTNNIQFPNPCDDQCKIQTVQNHMRENIDKKTAEIYQTQGTTIRSMNDGYQAMMWTGLGWALVGTGALYYTFKNL